MILSNVQIHRALDEGRLVIDPEPLPRLPQVGVHCLYDTHTVDLTLGDTIEVPVGNLPLTIDLTEAGSVVDLIRRASDVVNLGRDGYKLKPHQFILGHTRERIELPLQDEDDRTLAARIEGKSSRARFGLLVHFTAPTVHPNFKGTLTLEMINLGPYSISLIPGMAIAQLIVEEVRGKPLRNDSQFQNQSTPAGPSADSTPPTS